MDKNTKYLTSRDSNFELLRLICMFYIIMHHFLAHGMKIAGYYDEFISRFGWLNSFFVIAVNVFILISGYFGIKANQRGLFRLYFLCAFYTLGLTLLQPIILKHDFTARQIIISFLPFSHSKYWFIRDYFLLYLLSPFLNKLIEKLDKEQYVKLLFIYTIITFYFGFFWRGGINSNGYNLMNFTFLYFIARFIYLHTENNYQLSNRLRYIFIYLICSIIMVTFVIALSRLQIHQSWIKDIYKYNSPTVIISAVAFFMIFRTVKLKSKIVNWMAESALAIYLVHEHPVVNAWLYPFINKIGQSISNDFVLLGVLILFALAIMIICILVDKIRILLMRVAENIVFKIDWESIIKQKIQRIVEFIK